MKCLIVILAGIMIFACKQKTDLEPNSETSVEEVSSGDLDWVLGNWKRLNDEEGQITFENWDRLSNGNYVGLGFTMQNGDTVKQENMQIVKKGIEWELIVIVPGDDPVMFEMTHWDEGEFICENHEIDFPNKIRYWKEGEKINATVANAEMEIPFEFVKLDK